jgi:cell wall-associated NlpC family hydrolase
LLFVQLLLDEPKIRDLPIVYRQPKVGDVLQFGGYEDGDMALHWAVYLGNNEVAEVEEWGAVPQVADFDAVYNEYGGEMLVRASPQRNPGLIGGD